MIEDIVRKIYKCQVEGCEKSFVGLLAARDHYRRTLHSNFDETVALCFRGRD